MRLIFATGNENKLREVREIFAPLKLDITSMKEAGVERDPEETGETFEENSLIKSRAVYEALKEKFAEDELSEILVMADDSGLEIDYLGKEPGVHSARFMGHDTSYEEKNNELLRRLHGVHDDNRTARFVCAISCILPDGRELVKRETMEGHIAYSIRGEHGFGYDPIFIPQGFEVTSAELTPEDKNLISHRGKALRAMYKELSKEFSDE